MATPRGPADRGSDPLALRRPVASLSWRGVVRLVRRLDHGQLNEFDGGRTPLFATEPTWAFTASIFANCARQISAV